MASYKAVSHRSRISAASSAALGEVRIIIMAHSHVDISRSRMPIALATVVNRAHIRHQGGIFLLANFKPEILRVSSAHDNGLEKGNRDSFVR